MVDDVPLPAPRRTRATLVLGVLSGALAAVTVLPATIPLTWRVVATEDAAELRQVHIAATAVRALIDADTPLPSGLAARLGVDGLRWTGADQAVRWSDGVLPPLPSTSLPCTPRTFATRYVTHGDERWAVACDDRSGSTLIAVHKPGDSSATFVAGLVLGLALLVGISTALGVLQVLQPLSDVSRALQRVGAGERGVRATTTGLSELDELVDRLNAAAEAMEDREDAILARIELVQHLARMVAHEIRNPLQSLELLTSLIAAESERGEREDLAAAIQAEIRILESVVARLLRDAPGQAALRPTRTPTRIREIIQHVITLRRVEAQRKGIVLEAGVLHDVTIRLDRALVSRAVENLVTNALQAAPEGSGLVRVSTELEEAWFTLYVDDNGPGVAEHLGQSIYQANVTTREGGHGIGLALVQGVMQAHDGYVEHDGSPLGGARFTCRLPLEPDPTREAPRANPGGG